MIPPQVVVPTPEVVPKTTAKTSKVVRFDVQFKKGSDHSSDSDDDGYHQSDRSSSSDSQVRRKKVVSKPKHNGPVTKVQPSKKNIINDSSSDQSSGEDETGGDNHVLKQFYKQKLSTISIEKHQQLIQENKKINLNYIDYKLESQLNTKVSNALKSS